MQTESPESQQSFCFGNSVFLPSDESKMPQPDIIDDEQRVLEELSASYWPQVSVGGRCAELTSGFTGISYDSCCRASFRRTGPSTWGNLVFSAFVGAVSGHYIFAEPLKQYWAEEALRLKQEQAAGAAPADGGTPNPPTTNSKFKS